MRSRLGHDVLEVTVNVIPVVVCFYHHLYFSKKATVATMAVLWGPSPYPFRERSLRAMLSMKDASTRPSAHFLGIGRGW